MAGRKVESATAENVKPNMTPLIDVCFLLITFFVMLLTIAKDEAAQRITLPLASTAEVLEDDQIPDSLNLNVANNEAGQDATLLQWGLKLDLSKPDSTGWNVLRSRIRNEAALQKQRQREKGSDWKKDGLSTTVIFRVDEGVEYWVFRRIMDICRENNFVKFQLKARSEEEEANG